MLQDDKVIIWAYILRRDSRILLTTSPEGPATPSLLKNHVPNSTLNMASERSLKTVMYLDSLGASRVHGWRSMLSTALPTSSPKFAGLREEDVGPR